MLHTITINGHEFRFSDKDIANPDGMITVGSYNPYKIHPCILHEVGYVQAIVFAENLQDALDEAVDSNLLDHYQIVEAEFNDYACSAHDPEFHHDCDDCDASMERLGNASEPFDIENLEAIEVPQSKWASTLWTDDQLSREIEYQEDCYDSKMQCESIRDGYLYLSYLIEYARREKE